MLDENENMIFVSKLVLDIFGITDDEITGMPLDKLIRPNVKNYGELVSAISANKANNGKVILEADSPGGKQFWFEVEVKEDPENLRRKILFLYDVTEVYGLRKLLKGKAGFQDMTGKSSVMGKVFTQIRNIADVYWTVLIEGETGTGKELVARAIHSLGNRKDKPFIALNCAGLTESLLTSQLFGHRKGAFTGAVSDHKGFFETAEGGTVFLDEIGDVPLNVQANLLRFLESHEITVVGESVSKTVDVRVITATNKSLSDEVKKGNFRADLLYRIRVARITLPPLRERREDIPLLASRFLSEAEAFSGKKITDISTEVMALFLNYSWPGNVRELRSAIEFAVIHSKSSVIIPNDLPPEIADSDESVSSLALDSIEDERERFLEALRLSHGNRAKAARSLGISRATFYRHLYRLKL